MPSSEGGVQGKNLSRRRFIKRAGALAAAGAAAIALGDSGRVGPSKSAARSSGASGGGLVDSATSKVPAAAQNPKAMQLTPTPSGFSLMPDGAAQGILTESPFTIFWITDTQFLSESNPALFKMMNNWISSNWLPYNGKMVIHTGDLVQDGLTNEEWDNANSAMSILTANGIPYTWCAGNHDNRILSDATSGWIGNQWDSFNPSVMSANVNALPGVQWVSDSHDGMNMALTFSANDIDFLVVNVEWNAQLDVLQWLGGVLDDPAYANHRVIVAPHAYLDALGRLDDPTWGAMLADFIAGFKEILDAHSPRVFLTLNGHFATEVGYNTPFPVNYRNELMFDRQDCLDAPGDPRTRGYDAAVPNSDNKEKVGGSTVTLLTFDTQNNQIRVSTYDVYTGNWRTDDCEQYTVTMFPDQLPRSKLVLAV
jgi:Calcineurin-like phosphoesterase